MGTQQLNTANVLKQYICDEAGIGKKDRKAVHIEPNNNVFVTITQPDMPRQPNVHDCGMYVLATIEKILREPKFCREYLLVLAVD
jgi:Ulp1 family protease